MEKHFHDLGLILSSCSNMVSAEIPTALENISDILREESLAEEFSKVKSENGVDWLKLWSPRAENELNIFLKNHGHRVVKEVRILA